MNRNLAAFTPPGANPPYISINRPTPAGEPIRDFVEITVRGTAREDGMHSIAVITMGERDFLKLVGDALLSVSLGNVHRDLRIKPNETEASTLSDHLQHDHPAERIGQVRVVCNLGPGPHALGDAPAKFDCYADKEMQRIAKVVQQNARVDEFRRTAIPRWAQQPFTMVLRTTDIDIKNALRVSPDWSIGAMSAATEPGAVSTIEYRWNGAYWPRDPRMLATERREAGKNVMLAAGYGSGQQRRPGSTPLVASGGRIVDGKYDDQTGHVTPALDVDEFTRPQRHRPRPVPLCVRDDRQQQPTPRLDRITLGPYGREEDDPNNEEGA